MARTIRTKVYLFSELSDQAKQKVIEDNYDINVDYEWWESAYEDAANIGLKITGSILTGVVIAMANLPYPQMK